MAVLVEAISVIVRQDMIDSKYLGGWEAFVRAVPNATLCYDVEIARVGFMAPDDAKAFITVLVRNGLTFLNANKAVDVAVADQQRGLTSECDWLEFGRVSFGDGRVAICWFFDGPRIAAGNHARGSSMQLSTPAGWSFENSLSKTFGFVPTQDAQSRPHD